jgi:hypothetical protein
VADVEAALAQGAQEASAAAHIYEEFVVVDGAGRLQIPPDLRAEFDIGDRVTLDRSDGGILIRPVDGAGLDSSASQVSGTEEAEEEEQPSRRHTRLGSWLRSKRNRQ